MISCMLPLLLTRKDVHFEIPASGYRFDAANGGLKSDPKAHTTRFLLQGRAVAASKEIQFKSSEISGLLSSPAGKRASVLRHAQTEGPGTLTRISQTNSELTVLQGSGFVFDGDASSGHVRIAGPVQITDSGSGKSDLRMSGSRGLAELDMRDHQTESGLRSATLFGNVTIVIVEAGQPGSFVHATGDQLVLDNTTSPHTLTLEGHVSIHGQGKSEFGLVAGIQKVKFLLNRQGQFTDVRAGGTPY